MENLDTVEITWLFYIVQPLQEWSSVQCQGAITLLYLNISVCSTGPCAVVVVCWFCRIWPAATRAGSGPRWVAGWWSCREPEHQASISPTSLFSLCSHSHSSPEMCLEPPRLSARHHTLAATETRTDTVFCSYRWTQRAWQRFCLPFPSSASAPA